MRDGVRALVPVKVLSHSKLGLAGCLTAAERSQLTLAMLEDVLTNLAASDAVAGIVVVTRDPKVAEFARRQNVDVISEPDASKADGGELKRCAGIRSARNS